VVSAVSTSSSAKNIIYDFGSNNGDDIPYYLLKSDLVVAVEANPVLANRIRQRFKSEISGNRLIVENCVVTDSDAAGNVPFYLHKTLHIGSQFPRPAAADAHNYEQVSLPAKRAVEVVRAHGDPHYVKIDLEHYDHVVLKDLLVNGIRPPYISAESHSIKTFCLLVALGGYKAFKLVDGASVPTKYANHAISTATGRRTYAFPAHSAGPYGNDIRGPWMSDDNLFRVLAFAGLGWRDIHASALDTPDASYQPKPKFNMSVTIDY
jgi:FkbM family methyltransferase